MVMAGNCVFGIKELLNQRLLKMLEGNNFGFIKSLIAIYSPWPFHNLVVVIRKGLHEELQQQYLGYL